MCIKMGRRCQLMEGAPVLMMPAVSSCYPIKMERYRSFQCDIRAKSDRSGDLLTQAAHVSLRVTCFQLSTDESTPPERFRHSRDQIGTFVS
jgi:hypothetical protein